MVFHECWRSQEPEILEHANIHWIQSFTNYSRRRLCWFHKPFNLVEIRKADEWKMGTDDFFFPLFRHRWEHFNSMGRRKIWERHEIRKKTNDFPAHFTWTNLFIAVVVARLVWWLPGVSARAYEGKVNVEAIRPYNYMITCGACFVEHSFKSCQIAPSIPFIRLACRQLFSCSSDFSIVEETLSAIYTLFLNRFLGDGPRMRAFMAICSILNKIIHIVHIVPFRTMLGWYWAIIIHTFNEGIPFWMLIAHEKRYLREWKRCISSHSTWKAFPRIGWS